MLRQQNDLGRSYLEIDLQALKHNVSQLMTLLPSLDHFMAVVKADAYGHGAVALCHELEYLGVSSFAVATLSEAIELREAHIQGDILILGYTDPKQVALLHHYQLIQTIVDTAYAKTLNEQGIDIQVHIAIDTGMHRLGDGYNDIDAIQDIYTLSHLHVKGIFSHLCVSDTQDSSSIDFTHQQIQSFFQIIDTLRQRHYDVGKVHIQSSYGLLHYPHIPCDLARIGISLYGVDSSLADKKNNPLSLKPLLSLKSKIILLRHVQKDETIGYGRTYQTTSSQKIAVIPIGYADGLPRTLSNCGHVLIRGQKAPIIGRICMDQMMVDVTNIEHVEVNDEVTIIGEDHDEKIMVEDIADNSETISNEILSRLGQRLPKVYKGGSYAKTLLCVQS